MLETVLAGWLTVLSANAASFKEKIHESLKEEFQFDPNVENEPTPSEGSVVLMNPLVVQVKSMPHGVEAAVMEERIKLTLRFNLKDGGTLLKQLPLGFEAEVKAHEELIETDTVQKTPRWTLLRKKW